MDIFVIHGFSAIAPGDAAIFLSPFKAAEGSKKRAYRVCCVRECLFVYAAGERGGRGERGERGERRKRRKREERGEKEERKRKEERERRGERERRERKTAAYAFLLRPARKSA